MLTDETETLLLKEDVWDALREQFYAENQEEFYQLTANFPMTVVMTDSLT